MAQVAESPDRVESKPRHSDAHTQADRPRPRRIRQWVIYGLLLLLGLVGAGAAWAKIALDRVEHRALSISEAGVSLNKVLKKYSTAIKEQDINAVVAIYDENYAAEQDGLWSEELVSERDGALVYEWRSAHHRTFAVADIRSQAADHFSRIARVDKSKFKIASIEELSEDGTVVIRCVLWLLGKSSGGQTLESRTWFRLTLQHDNRGAWKITNKEMLHGQTTLGSGQGFTEVTQAAGIDYRASHNPILNESQWHPRAFGIMKYSSGGVSTGDYDGDGWVDVLFTDGGSTRLYRNLGDGRFEDNTVPAGLPRDLKGGTTALLVDLDNDNDQDLLLCRGTGNNYLFRNNGDGTFEDVTDAAGVQGVWVAVAAAADYDNDGLVDIYLGRYLDPRDNIPTTSFYTRNGEGNTLLHNEGNLRFIDVTENAGVSDGGLTLGIAWGDYNDDGFEDIYVANDFGRNALFKNNGNGTFTDVSEEAGTINIGYGMSAQFGDIDNDGDLDILVGALHSGQRWFGNSATIQRYLVSSLREGTIWQDWDTYYELYRYLGHDWSKLGEEVLKGNTLMLNNGDGTFTDVTEQAHVNPHGWYWSTRMFDFDCDGYQDVFSVAGWITGKLPDDL